MLILFIFLSLVFLFSLVSERAAKSIITGPMVFTAAGIVLFFALPDMNELFPQLAVLEIANPIVLLVGELTLAVVLFSEATHISLRRVTKENQLPVRLLAIGMPLAIVAGTLAALLLTGMQLWEAAILATILAPTDASLGSAVVKSDLVPPRIRQALNVESGLNDGLSVPLLVLFIGLSGAYTDGQGSILQFTAEQIGFGLLVGLGMGWIGGFLTVQSQKRGWLNERSKQLAMLALALLAWGLAEKLLHGNGFIAAFVAGGAVRLSYEHADTTMHNFDEEWGHLLVYFIFFVFGLVAAPWLANIGGRLWLYGLLSLTLVRMGPVAIAMIGTKLHPSSVLFLGWFGPRGLASVVLGLIYLDELGIFSMNSVVVLGMIATVLLSVLSHGVSANPAVKLYARQIGSLEVTAPEYTIRRPSSIQDG